jgi:hypothetical protein
MATPLERFLNWLPLWKNLNWLPSRRIRLTDIEQSTILYFVILSLKQFTKQSCELVTMKQEWQRVHHFVIGCCCYISTSHPHFSKHKDNCYSFQTFPLA